MAHDAMDDEAVRPLLAREYKRHKVADNELSAKPVREMDAAELGSLVDTLAHSDARYPKMTAKLADVIRADNIDGALLLAGGHKYLVDSAGVVTTRKEQNPLLHCARRILKSLEEHDDKPQTYWERMEQSRHDDDHFLGDQFRDSPLAAVIKDALVPLPLSAVRYVCVDWVDTTNVQIVDNHVEKVREDQTQQFKVVSVCLADDPDTVRTNLIYSAGINQPNKWKLLLSVDFANHGSARPGHWHLNRTPDTSLVQHWGVKGVWHGSPENCPLWWMLIPDGRHYHTTPARVQLFRDECP